MILSACYVTVEQVEPVARAVLQQSIEFGLCYLEKCIRRSDDSSLQVCNYFLEHKILF